VCRSRDPLANPSKKNTAFGKAGVVGVGVIWSSQLINDKKLSTVIWSELYFIISMREDKFFFISPIHYYYLMLK
jgi:hypothetical protein